MTTRTNRLLAQVIAALQTQLTEFCANPGALGHAGLDRLMRLVCETLHTVNAPARGTPISFSDHLHHRELALAQPHIRIAEPSGDDDTARPDRRLASTISDLLTALARRDLPDTVAAQSGAVRTIDHLRATVLLCVDLALDTIGTAQPAALAEAVRSLAVVLAERHPGQAIEVRVPPYAAAQVGAHEAGPAHTRGTPPNVVETNPQAFLALATARLTWRQAIETGQLNRSGAHADEAGRMFPVLRLH